MTRGGQRLEGTVQALNWSYVELTVGGEARRIPVDEVEAVQFRDRAPENRPSRRT